MTVHAKYLIPAPKDRQPPKCPYCGRLSVLMNSAAVYQRAYGPIWCCWACQAWVGCHRDSKDYAPLGRLANDGLRKLKRAAHAAFDPVWDVPEVRLRKWRRKQAYKLLAQQMGIEDWRRCHIGWFDDEDCQRAISIMGTPLWRVLVAGISNDPPVARKAP